MNQRTCTVDKISEGIRRFIYGLGKKVIIANTVAYCVDTIYALDYSDITGWLAWIGAILYTLQIYYDFSGYSDMAIGLGKICGFEFQENFNYPYLSKSIQEFWQRWHISLGTWFKEYLYIPLGGNKKGKKRTAWNLRALGMDDNTIADAVNVQVALVKNGLRRIWPEIACNMISNAEVINSA